MFLPTFDKNVLVQNACYTGREELRSPKRGFKSGRKRNVILTCFKSDRKQNRRTLNLAEKGKAHDSDGCHVWWSISPRALQERFASDRRAAGRGRTSRTARPGSAARRVFAGEINRYDFIALRGALRATRFRRRNGARAHSRRRTDRVTIRRYNK